MDNLKDRFDERDDRDLRDIKDRQRLRREATAATTELRKFIRGLKGRSPQEVMGIVSGNALAQAIVTATIGCVLMLAVLSVPFAFGSSKDKSKSKPTAVTEAEPSQSEADTKATSVGDGETPSEENVKRASKAMGLDETKVADPTKNPLDSFDNLLDKVK